MKFFFDLLLVGAPATTAVVSASPLAFLADPFPRAVLFRVISLVAFIQLAYAVRR